MFTGQILLSDFQSENIPNMEAQIPPRVFLNQDRTSYSPIAF